MRHLAIAILCACGAKPPPSPPPPSAPPSLAELTWLEGAWHGDKVDERWLTVETALWGVALNDTGYEVNVIDDTDDEGKPMPVSLITMDGTSEEHSAFASAQPQSIAFGKLIFARTGDALHGSYAPPGKPAVMFAVSATPPGKAQPLEDADVQFAKDTAAHGADGWTPWFAATGMMWRAGKPVTGAEAVHAAIAKTLEHGMLVWQPVASGVRGDWGFTLGSWTFGKAHGSYCTIWHREAGGWKVAFDVGREAS